MAYWNLRYNFTFDSTGENPVTAAENLDLLRRARAGDEESLSQLLLEFHKPLISFIESKLGSSKVSKVVSADDILQETYFDVIRNISRQTRDDENAFEAWLRAIAVNRIRDAARSASAKKRGGDHAQVTAKADPYRSTAGNLVEEFANDSVTASRVAAKAEAVTAMQIELARLPEDQQQALVLLYFDQLSYEAIADAMNRTPGSVRGLIKRARQKLRTQMDHASKWLSG